MLPEDLQRRMRFTHPDDGVSVRNRQYRWKNPAYEIKNIRRNSEDPGNSTVYYEDTGGNKYKTNAQMFVERFGDFYIESNLKMSIKRLSQAPGYDSPLPAVENTNPASIPRDCPNCGCKAMGSAISSAIEQGKTELKCCRCGFSINIAPDEKFLMVERNMTKAQKENKIRLDPTQGFQSGGYYPLTGDAEIDTLLKKRTELIHEIDAAEDSMEGVEEAHLNLEEFDHIYPHIKSLVQEWIKEREAYSRSLEGPDIFKRFIETKKISKLNSALKKLGQWKEQIMDLSDDLYYPTEMEVEDPTMNRIRQLEEELGLEPMDLADTGMNEDEYLAYLEEEAGMWIGQAKKAQSREDLDFPPELDPIETEKHEKLVRDKLKREKEFYKKKDKEFERFKDKPLPMIGQAIESLKEETKDYDAEILDGMARCLFVNAWADFAEETLGASFSGMELMDVAPETPPESFEKAKGLYNEIKSINNVDLSTFVPPGIDPDEGFDKDLFGHYLCMEALGHGVSWKDDHEDHGLKLPMIEAYADMDFSEATLRQIYEEFDKEFPEGDYTFESEPVFETKSKKAQLDPFTFKISIMNFPIIEDITANNLLVDLEKSIDTDKFMIKSDGVYTTSKEDAMEIAAFLDSNGWEIADVKEQRSAAKQGQVYRDPQLDAPYKVKAILSKMRPGEEIDAWGMSREIHIEPIRAEQLLNQFVEEGLVTKDGNWFAPVEGVDWSATENKDIERDSTWFSLVNEGR